MTEEEAKTRYCPLFALAAMMAATCNKDLTGFDVTKSIFCVGSKCMLWRTGDTEEHFCELDHVDKQAPPYEWRKPDGDGWYRDARNGWHRKKDDGYCGLAGEP